MKYHGIKIITVLLGTATLFAACTPEEVVPSPAPSLEWNPQLSRTVHNTCDIRFDFLKKLPVWVVARREFIRNFAAENNGAIR